MLPDQKNKLFIDVDGTVGAFDQLAQKILGMPSREFEARHGAKEFWRRLRHWRCEHTGLPFFEAMEPLDDALHLIDSVRHLSPTFLTGCPFGNWAPEQKVRWANRVFPGLPIITCPSKDKKLHMEPGDIIIDDYEKHKQVWLDAGGIWITHTSAESSLAQLRDLKPEWF